MAVRGVSDRRGSDISIWGDGRCSRGRHWSLSFPLLAFGANAHLIESKWEKGEGKEKIN